MTKQLNLCRCGCGKLTAKTYAPGHDQVAVWRVIKERYGDTEAFLKAHEEPAVTIIDKPKYMEFDHRKRVLPIGP